MARSPCTTTATATCSRPVTARCSTAARRTAGRISARSGPRRSGSFWDSPVARGRQDMADGETVRVDFRTEPSRYKHWKLGFDWPVATLAMDVQEDGGLRPGHELKLNSYDLGVGVQLPVTRPRARVHHPEIGAVVITPGKERGFC